MRGAERPGAWQEHIAGTGHRGGGQSQATRAKALCIRRHGGGIVADETISGGRPETGRDAWRACLPAGRYRCWPKPMRGTQTHPATTRRTSAESRYKKSNKYFMREIL
ncbi:hypothetical protein EVG18_32650 [Burkholderia pyrrocinia]|nr:hypothetical protein EVG18_32650 [Burkholderia pyrrocinia]